MPKNAMDYSKCVIYKIVCNDLTVTDCYVGQTTSFIDRKASHKKGCNNNIYKQHNLKVYKIIRQNGGWENWSMIEIEKFPCKDNNEATARERFWYEQLNANMNSCVPNRSQKELKQIYYKNNKVELNHKHKIYYEKNKDKFLARCKEYNEENKDKLKENYYTNKKYIMLQKFNCECGGKYCASTKQRHFKSNKHLNFILANSNNDTDGQTDTED